MSDLFEGARLKIARAKRHFNDLEAEVMAFTKRGPYPVTAHDDPDTGDQLFKVAIREQIPLDISAVIGDLVHNLRAALDLAICAAIRSNGQPVITQNAFPIYNERREFRQKAESRLVGVNARTQRLVHLLRPYQSGRKALWTLHNLDIVDKHNSILLAAASYRHFVLRSKLVVPWQDTPIEFPGVAIAPKDRQFPIQDGATVLKVAAAARREPQDNYEFAFEICFGEGNALAGEPLTTLRAIGDATERIVAMIEAANR